MSQNQDPNSQRLSSGARRWYLGSCRFELDPALHCLPLPDLGFPHPKMGQQTRLTKLRQDQDTEPSDLQSPADLGEETAKLSTTGGGDGSPCGSRSQESGLSAVPSIRQPFQKGGKHFETWCHAACPPARLPRPISGWQPPVRDSAQRPQPNRERSGATTAESNITRSVEILLNLTVAFTIATFFFLFYSREGQSWFRI